MLRGRLSRIFGGLFSYVDLHVGVQRASVLVGLFAHVAAERFFTGVRHHVPLQVDLLDKAFVAEVAEEGFVFLVEPLVRLQGDLLAKPFPTEAANEWLLARVNPHVRVQVADLPEALVADLTGERLLPRVDSFVHVQVLAHGELLVADFAGINPELVSCVVLDVPFQDCVFRKRFPAELADVRPLISVLPLVSLQRAFPGKFLPTVFALKGFQTCVRPHVDLHVPEVDATDFTDPAGLSVTLDVELQALRRFGLLSADATKEVRIV